MSDLKKYPITYKGKEYEIRWEKHTYYGEVMDTYINLYQVTPTIFNIKRYKKVHSSNLKTIKLALKMNNIFENNPQYYVEQAKCVFNIYLGTIKAEEEKEQLKQAKYKALAEWNGVIE